MPRILLVDLSHYPCLEFPQLNKGLVIDETKVAIEDGDNVYTALFLTLSYLFLRRNYTSLTMTMPF